MSGKKSLRDKTNGMSYSPVKSVETDQNRELSQENKPAPSLEPGDNITREEKLLKEPKSKPNERTEKVRAAKKSVKSVSEEKVRFMTYLDDDAHKDFTMIYVDVRAAARRLTGKQLSQSEMVEVFITFAKKAIDGDLLELINIAEDKIKNRQ